MKKIIALGVLSLGIFFLAGCSQQQASQNQNTNQQVTQPQNIVYENSTYGFTLTFPQTWKDYTAKNRTIDRGTLGTNDSIDFGFSVQDSLFNISVLSKSQWEKLKSEEGPTPTYLGENSQYVFGYATAQDSANDIMVARMSEVQEIVKTFVSTQNYTQQNIPSIKTSAELMKELIIKNYPTAVVENYKIFEEVKSPNQLSLAVLFGLDTEECCSEPTGIFINNQGSLGAEYDILEGALEHMYLENAKWQDDKSVLYDFVISDEGGKQVTQRSIENSNELSQYGEKTKQEGLSDSVVYQAPEIGLGSLINVSEDNSIEKWYFVQDGKSTEKYLLIIDDNCLIDSIGFRDGSCLKYLSTDKNKNSLSDGHSGPAVRIYGNITPSKSIQVSNITIVQ